MQTNPEKIERMKRDYTFSLWVKVNAVAISTMKGISPSTAYYMQAKANAFEVQHKEKVEEHIMALLDHGIIHETQQARKPNRKQRRNQKKNAKKLQKKTETDKK